MAEKTNTNLKPSVIAKIIAKTEPITEKKPLKAQLKAINFLSESSIRLIPTGNGIPIKNPSGAIMRTETRIRYERANFVKPEKINGLKIPIKIENKAIRINIKCNLVRLLLRIF